MKFLVDAQLPQRLIHLLRDNGHDAIHTRDLPAQNRTPDEVINQISLADRRVVITKDTDFVNTHLLHRKPHKLLVVSTGNISNDDLLPLVDQNLGKIVEAFQQYTYVELGRGHLTIHC